ncbi:MAG TPA: glycosyltransferase [Methylomirabilota bacterium]|nr:glycosyltransferase [Methylomirabilota bacterium]
MGGVRSGHGSRGLGADDPAQYRVLIYSHDSFGLGHLRRCRTIAHSLVAHQKKLNVLIMSGSPIVGRFSFRSRVDFVRVPGIIKRRNGEYTSLNLDFHVEQTLALRASIIEHTARVFRPHLFLVDKEPLGLLGEVQSTLALLRRKGGTRLVLGLRDIMDDPTSLAEEWRRKRVIPALKRFYDQIWVYGLSQVYDPIEAYGFPADVAGKTTFTGYLPRETNPEVTLPADVQAIVQQGPFLLVTPGGGGDGALLVDATLAAYERFNGRLPWPALVVYGPFLPARERAAFERRAARLPRVTTLEFHEHLENLVEKAAAVVCLGGYNTFCEVLSLKKRSLIVPRVTPRAEQLLRAQAAARLGLAQTLDPGRLTPETLAEAVSHLPEQPPPATHRVPGLLDGLRFINQAVAKWRVEGPPRPGIRGLDPLDALRRLHPRRAG